MQNLPEDFGSGGAIEVSQVAVAAATLEAAGGSHYVVVDAGRGHL